MKDLFFLPKTRKLRNEMKNTVTRTSSENSRDQWNAALRLQNFIYSTQDMGYNRGLFFIFWICSKCLTKIFIRSIVLVFHNIVFKKVSKWQTYITTVFALSFFELSLLEIDELNWVLIFLVMQKVRVKKLRWERNSPILLIFFIYCTAILRTSSPEAYRSSTDIEQSRDFRFCSNCLKTYLKANTWYDWIRKVFDSSCLIWGISIPYCRFLGCPLLHTGWKRASSFLNFVNLFSSSLSSYTSWICILNSFICISVYLFFFICADRTSLCWNFDLNYFKIFLISQPFSTIFLHLTCFRISVLMNSHSSVWTTSFSVGSSR